MLQFRIQSTPNPRARKYVVNQDLKADGKATYQSPEECQHVPMAHELMSISGITQIHFFENVLTVTQDDSVDWPVLDQIVQEVITEHFDNHDNAFAHLLQVQDSSNKPREELSPELKKIDEILDNTMRPALQMDGGDVRLVNLEENVLSIEYEGACGGCPSSSLGTLEAIRMTLRDEYQSDLEVVIV